MKQHKLTVLVFLVGLFALAFVGCSGDTPLITPNPDAAAGENSGNAVAPTPTPLPDNPTIEETLAAGLAYVADGFRLDMPPAESFTPTTPPDLSGLEVEQALASGPWTVAIGPVQPGESGLNYRTIVISNESGNEAMRWWGQVDENGLASKVVFSGMPRPESRKVKGMVGKVVQLPPGSAYERYFENEKGQRFGIASNKDVIKQLLEKIREEDGLIQVWGELRYATDDYNGRRILVRNYDLKETEPETILNRTNEEVNAPSQDTDSGDNFSLGPIAIIYEPKPRSFIHGQVQVSGEVDEPNGDQIVVRVEQGENQALGEVQVTLDPAENGVARFTTVLPFNDPPSMADGRVAVYANDPATGQPMLLGWQEVRLAGDVGDKRVTIVKPEEGAEIRRTVKVAGTAENIPTQSLLVQVEDTAGVVLGKSKAKVGGNGNWATKIQFRRPKTVRPGVIAVYYVNPDDNSLTLLAMTPVKLKR